MSLLFESILVENGELKNVEWHRRRMQKSVLDIFKIKKYWNEIVELNALKKKEKYKCKIIYNTEIISIAFEKYKPKIIKKIIPIIDNDIDYSYKYLDRKAIEKHTKKLNIDEECIFIKHGYITDSSYSNLAFWTGKEWHTPIKPMLNGTRRQYLLENNLIVEKNISWSEMYKYKKISFINALNNLGENEIIL